MFVLKVYADRPDILGLEWGLLPDQFAFVPGLTRLIGFHFRLLLWLMESDCVAHDRMAASGRSAE